MSAKKGRIMINPPPRDGHCNVCGKHMDELKAFGGAGDPLMGDFTGAKLVKMFRPMAPQLSVEQVKELVQKHGDEAEGYMQLQCTIEASWECRDCVVLFDEDYFKKRFGKKDVH